MKTAQKEITILEDDGDIREICTYFFASQGFKVNGYGNVKEFSTPPPSTDVFLLDVRLPDGNGLAVCRMLKSDVRYEHIPVIMMSAHMDTSVMMDRCGADHFISKPFDLDLLLEKVVALTK